MTRQKKELIRKIDEIERFVAADEELGCGFAPADFYQPLHEKAYGLLEELAKLRKFRTAEDMMMDPRGYGDMSELPFA